MKGISDVPAPYLTCEVCGETFPVDEVRKMVTRSNPQGIKVCECCVEDVEEGRA
jgi:hypothetical protein